MEDAPDGLPLAIGRRVAARRAALGLSLDEVAARSAISRAMVSRIERGEVHASAVVLDKLCGGLGMTLSALFAAASASPLLKRAEQPVWRDPETG
ncbi:MAG TPA: helix-turn-helix transcriptional regulator, partial [Bauldia sp.]|nr:helix-turn-helix transcriptional regulator [Bauldia sp.]